MAMSYDDAVRVRQEHMSPAMLAFYKKPLMITKGKEQYLWDHEGRKYLDLFAGIVTVSVASIAICAVTQSRRIAQETR